MRRLAALSLIIAAILFAVPVSAGEPSTYHEEIEVDMTEVLNQIRSEYGLEEVELREMSSLPSAFLQHRDCIINLQANGLQHDDFGQCEQSGMITWDYRANTEILASSAGDYNVITTLMSLHNSSGHRQVMLSNADWVTVYSACYDDKQTTYIGFGRWDNGPILSNTTERINLNYTNFAPAADGDLAYHGCNPGQSNAKPPIVQTQPAISPLSASVGRLYSAYFNRAPDQGGHEYWTLRQAQGMNLWRISDFFADSVEFKQTYGHLSDREFVALVYENVLDRAPDADGLSFWTSQMNDGLTRGELMVGFSESPEYVAKTNN